MRPARYGVTCREPVLIAVSRVATIEVVPAVTPHSAVSVCAPAELMAPSAAMPGFVDAPTGPLTIPTTCRGCTQAVVAPDAVTRQVRMASASAPVPYAVSESWYDPAGTSSVRRATYPPVATSNPASCAEM